MRDRTLAGTFVSICLLVACTAPHGRGAASAPHAEAPKPKEISTPSDGCDEPPLAPATDLRDRALESLLRGDTHAASVGFRSALRVNPIDVGSYALSAATHVVAHQERAGMADALLAAKPIVVTSPLERQAAQKPLELPAQKAIGLGAPKETQNEIESTALLARAGIEVPGELDSDVSDLGLIAESHGLSKSFHGSGRDVFVFGDTVVGVSTSDGGPIRTFDFEHAAKGALAFVEAADVVGGTLIVGVGEGAATKPEGKSFLEAVDIDTGAIRWVSDEGVSSADSFVVAGRFVVTGADMTSGGAINVLDLATGALVTRATLSFTPEYVVTKGDHIWAVAWGRTAELEVIGGLSRRAAGKAPSEEKPFDPRMRCALRRSLAALDQRDGGGALRELERLEKTPLTLALKGAASFIERAKTEPDSVVDLTVKRPIVVDAAVRAVSSPSKSSNDKVPKLRKIEPARANPTARKKRNADGPDPMSEAQDDAIEATDDVSFEMPDSYGGDSLVRGWSFGDGNVVQYGDNYLAVLDGMRTKNVFDISRLRAPRNADKDVDEDVTIVDVALRGSILYVGLSSTADGTIIALDTSTGAVVWKSSRIASLVHFVMFREYLFAAGTPEASNGASAIVLLSSTSGEIASTTNLPALPVGFGYLASSHDIADGKAVLAVQYAGRFDKYRIE